ncbi:MAG: class I tRNA ligase family protein [bacterium]|nr:class I tRNA ligase family protein [bacterium]
MAINKAKDDQNAKSDLAKKEEEVLAFWRAEKVFEKSEQKLAEEEFVFYDGPPFATGLPHYGHILAGTIKDVIPRYQTMKGKRVLRRWGWDCHGLPLENIVEQELGFKSKKDILDFGIGQFNLKAREAVLRYAADWRAIVPRLGRWVDMENDYKTMDASYTESVWWIFKTLHNKKLIYEGYKSMHLCPRCETTLSNFEVNQGYKDIEDLTVTVEFELFDRPKTYLLAWTTTPWTLPGNVALAVNPEIEYVEVKDELEGNVYILASSRVKEVFDDNHKVIKTFLGKKLIGQKYKTVFDYYLKGGEVYGADFVTTEEGTGIVHIAPAFGDDDYQLSQTELLPFIQPVSTDGKFKSEVKDFAGLLVKPKNNHQETDKLVVKKLAQEGKVFSTALITHSYPHCWRCETPLLNYAANSWFVKVTDFKDQLVVANKQISWVPKHIKEGRFGKWLEGARDWAISRSRFWGAPLPVWQCTECKEQVIIGSLIDLKKHLPRAKNNYVAIRHGEATNNVDNRVSSRVDNDDCLTTSGREEVVTAVKNLRGEKIDLIISSDFKRTKETAELLAEQLELDKNQIIFDKRLWEINAGELEGKNWQEYEAFFAHHKNNLADPLPAGESLLDVRRRTFDLLLELESKYKGKNILLVTHGLPLLSLLAGAAGVPDEKLTELKAAFGPIKRATPYPVELNFYPRNELGSLDLHRPFIDEVSMVCSCGEKMSRVPEVFDCWFESGAMPYGQAHYPFSANHSFDPKKKVGFPAEFIAEGLDQTRGWFYSLLVLGVALFGQSPYRRVVVNGLVLAADGQKMSKSLKNYPDPLVVINRYGADALRFYLINSPAVRAEDLNFSELGVAEVSRKIIARLLNVLNFYQTYTNEIELTDRPNIATEKLGHILDRWILARLQETINNTTEALDNYELDKATREVDGFIDDLSNWYLRRSRERFKSEDTTDREAAIVTTRHILRELAKLLAPFTPFMAEQIFLALKYESDPVSVHLTSWPTAARVDEAVIITMTRTRQLVEVALAVRSAAGFKIRQPLARLTLKEPLPPEYAAILAQELNIKTVDHQTDLTEDLVLDTKLTPELKAEGEMRELVRQVQEERKQASLTPSDKIILTLPTDYKTVVDQFTAEIKKATKAEEIKIEGVDKIIVTKLF